MIVTELPTMRYLSLGSDMFCECTKFFIIEKHHTTTTCGDGLVAIETNSTYFTKSTSVLALVKRSYTFCCILN